MKRLALTVLFATSLVVLGWQPSAPAAGAEASLTIGSKAPNLDIEHWLQDGNGFFKPVKEFESGKIYVVEFWATWCGPCIMSMPHLAELQQKYRGNDVQVISITNETVGEVKELLDQEHPQEGKTFNEITAAYSLTADPDESVYEDYMTASNAEGIPTAFIVGKSGIIEWIGHPMSMEEPLEEIVADSWDREAYKKQLDIENQLQEDMQQMAQLAGSGKIDEATEFVIEKIASAPNETIKGHWINIGHNIKLSTGKLDEETIAYYRNQLVDMEQTEDLFSLLRFGNMLFDVAQRGSTVKPLSQDALTLMKKFKNDVPEQYLVFYHNTSALLYETEGNYKAAAESQQAAVDAAEPRQAARMLPYLKELKEKAGMETKVEEKTETAKSETKSE